MPEKVLCIFIKTGETRAEPEGSWAPWALVSADFDVETLDDGIYATLELEREDYASPPRIPRKERHKLPKPFEAKRPKQPRTRIKEIEP